MPPRPPAELEYERPDLKVDQDRVARLLARRPGRAMIAAGWVGPGLLLWGSALLPGGIVAIAFGAVLASAAVVRLVWWEAFGRPYLWSLRVDALPVRHRWWLLLLLVTSIVIVPTGAVAPAVGWLTRPV